MPLAVRLMQKDQQYVVNKVSLKGNKHKNRLWINQLTKIL